MDIIYNMGDIKRYIQQNVSAPIANNYGIRYHEGIVTKADRENNVCTVWVANLNGGQEYENVPVALHDEGTNWFPKAARIDPDSPVSKVHKDIDSLVTVEENSSGVVINGPWRGTPYPEFRASQAVGNSDTNPDSGGAPPGAMID